MAERLRAGVVWANTYNRFDPSSPFGGYKESGFGREGGLHGCPSTRRTSSTSAGSFRAASPVARTRRRGRTSRARRGRTCATRCAPPARGSRSGRR
jgi:hypothetical protein